MRAWVSRSGREGVGISVEIDARDTGLSFEVDPAATTLRFERSGRVVQATRVMPADAPPERRRLYLPMRFDGLTAWNGGDRRALLRLGLRSSAGTRAALIRLSQSLSSPHERRDGPAVGPGSQR